MIHGRRLPRATIASMNPVSSKNSERWNPAGSSSPIVPAETRAPLNPISAFGSATFKSPSAPNDAMVPPVVGSVRRLMNVPPLDFSRAIAASVFGSCISA